RQLIDVGNVFDVDKEVDVASAFANLHDDVGSTGEDAGAIALVGQQRDRLGHSLRSGIIECLHVRRSFDGGGTVATIMVGQCCDRMSVGGKRGVRVEFTAGTWSNLPLKKE